MFRAKSVVVFFLDVALIAASLYLSFLLRFDFRIPASQSGLLSQALAAVLVAKPVLFAGSGMYGKIWRYASLRDACEIFKVVTLGSLVATTLLVLISGPFAVPRSIYILDWFVLLALVSASRLSWRIYRETQSVASVDMGKRTLIIGAGDAGNLLLKEIRKQENSPYHVVGFVDDNPGKRGFSISGVRVLGGTESLFALVTKHQVEEVIFAIPSGDGALMRRVVASCELAKARFKTLPGITDIIDGKVCVSQIKDVEIEDLLGREPVVLDQGALRNRLSGKRVLVTGAAGSIGSEICRQVALFSPSKLILFDNAETPLFYVERELVAAFPELRIIPVVGDVKNRDRVENAFDQFNPEVVFHAAAYKHVAMMEYNPAEAVLNNVLGSRVVADAADKFQVKNLVMVSTDKAVNPTNIMGATKRIAEIYVQALAARSKTNFTTVRFGNVLGSNGSVIPLFKEQIRKGGPVTVTDREVVRFFMTIPEAAQLVMQAGCIGKGGEIFVLDMGEPVRILDLAEELIKLSGFTPYKEIDIEFTGLKPGEKLFEELLLNGEGVKPTTHKKICVSDPVKADLKRVTGQLELLIASARASDIPAILKSLRAMVPEFVPSYHFDVAPAVAFQRVRPDLFPAQKLSLVRNLQLASWKEETAA